MSAAYLARRLLATAEPDSPPHQADVPEGLRALLREAAAALVLPKVWIFLRRYDYEENTNQVLSVCATDVGAVSAAEAWMKADGRAWLETSEPGSDRAWTDADQSMYLLVEPWVVRP